MTPPDSIDWRAIDEIDKWLDAEVSEQYKNEPLAQDWARIGKIAEELGEAIAALVGTTGQNPRKGYTHLRINLLDELADVAITAILGIQHYTKNTAITRETIWTKLLIIHRRVPTSPSYYDLGKKFGEEGT